MKPISNQQDRVRGSLIGGAIGDALGYPVEFLSTYQAIQEAYGPQGITRLDPTQHGRTQPHGSPKALVSDDTQMTLFTACGLLNAAQHGEAPIPYISQAYIEWFLTQVGTRSPRHNTCWINAIPELWATRAPGNTCLNALSDRLSGYEVHNDSKGCGGIMRIAPIPLYGAIQNRIADLPTVDRLAADASALTHLHPLGYIPSALLAHVIYRLVQDEQPTRTACETYLREGLALLPQLFPNDSRYVKYQTQLIEKAIQLAQEEHEDHTAIERQLGGGWVAEETLAIAVYCTLKYFDHFEQALIASVNHAGDSDSTGAVTGNLLGAACGYEAIPQHYKTQLELHDVIVHVADDLYQGQTTPFLP